MNIANLEFIAEWLEAGAPHKGKVKGFNIEVGVQARKGDAPACGTTCCIAGAATQFFNDDDGSILRCARENFSVWSDDDATAEADWDKVFFEAQDLLGLTFNQAQELFVPIGTESPDSIFGNGNADWSDFNDPQKAARVIRNLIKTGTVDWSIE